MNVVMFITCVDTRCRSMLINHFKVIYNSIILMNMVMKITCFDICVNQLKT